MSFHLVGKVDGTIDYDKLYECCKCGLDESSDRALLWLVFSHVFSNRPEKWPTQYEEIVSSYLTLVETFKICGYQDIPFQTAQFNQVFPVPEDGQAIMKAIHTDIVRTLHQIQFIKDIDTTIPNDAPPMAPFHMHVARIERILYIFSKMNTGHGYMQGFNELACVIYYVMSSQLSEFENNYDHVEAFSYTFFQTLFGSTGLDELFNTTENSSTIFSRLNCYSELLRKHLPIIHSSLIQLNIPPMVYCLNWITLLFSQDYFIPDLVLIWDGLMAHFDDLLDYLNYLAVAQISFLQDEIDPKNYVQTIKVLQGACYRNVKLLLQEADRLWNLDHPSS